MKSLTSRLMTLNLKILLSIQYKILIPLTNLINIYINKNIFPEVLKISRVVPVHKKCSLNEPSNYRPIAIILVWKNFEERIVPFSSLLQLFNECPYGFRKNSSTTAVLSALTKYINLSLRTKYILMFSS